VIGRVDPGWSPDTDGRRALSAGRREEVETGAGGGAGEVEAKEGITEGDADAGEDALVDLGLARAEQAAQLVGTVAHRGAGAIVQQGDEGGEVPAGDERRQAGVRGPGSTARGCPATTRRATAMRSFQPGSGGGVRRVGSIIASLPLSPVSSPSLRRRAYPADDGGSSGPGEARGTTDHASPCRRPRRQAAQ